ncbi:hypothetical protein FE257_000139 [Aspergillus nanangensis]|uniref:Zn(2)-C6 fungal-type domain-containing protein n=1 Tax=Aspergillus nanangensis TaxID=2582783 RepID=A0AAD4CZ81_ASPNN|nr:hypothetical protein FE257_000139 [Aspergillus nanangensis]
MSSNSTSPPSSILTGAPPAHSAPESSTADFRPHGNLDTVRTSEAGPAVDKRMERRRSTLTGSDRKRRLVNTDGDVWSRRAVSGQDPNHLPEAAFMTPHPGQPVSVGVDESVRSPATLNPALGGGEEVRLCNPCVPDPNPEPPRGYGAALALGEPRSGSYGVPGQSRHRSYHSLSSGTRPSVPENFFTRPGRRTVGSNDYPSFGHFGGSYGSRFHERPDYGAFSTSRFTTPVRSSIRSLPPPATSRTTVHAGDMPQIDDCDLCPICDNRLPPFGASGNEDAREAHIRECIESHGRQGRSPSHGGGSHATQSPLSVRMIAFAATEKDCMGEDGTVQECTICTFVPRSQRMEVDPRLRDNTTTPDSASDSDSADARHFSMVSPASRSGAPTAPGPDSTNSRSGSSSYADPPRTPSGSQYHTGTTTHNLDPSDPNDPYSDLKRSRACEACRQLKVRCEPNPNGSCKRCAKAKRHCVVTAPTRKRQKKTDSRVAELERKIDALTASLQTSHDRQPDFLREPLAAGTTATAAPRDDSHGRRWLGATHGVSVPTSTPALAPAPTPPSVSPGVLKRGADGEVKEVQQDRGGRALDEHAEKYLRGPWAAKPDSTTEYVDIIDRGLVSVEIAGRAFERYVTRMAARIPMVVFPAGTTMADIRKTKPLLFHAVVSVAVGVFQPDAQVPLTTDFHKVIAERVIVKGEKSLEIVQALLVSCSWYMVPDHFEELKFYQMAHLAVSVAIEIGMYRKSTAKNRQFNFLRDYVHKKPLLEQDSPELRRAWLGCYFLSVQVTTSLRRAILVRWNSYMDECVEILEKSPNALPTDRAMIEWAKLTHIMEDINLQFSSDDTGPFSEPKVQYTLKVFERQLEQWRRETPQEDHTPIISQTYHIMDLYMHEGAMQLDPTSDDPDAPEDNPTSPAHINALTTCITSCHKAINIVCSIDIHDLLDLPVVCQARTSFAVIALIKLYSIISAPETGLGQVIEPSSLKTNYYLDRVIEHYRAAGDLDGGRTPAKFSVVLGMLQKWFNSRKDRSTELKDAFSGRGLTCGDLANEEDRERQPSKPGPQTPLHVLSEVAMGDPNTRPNTIYARDGPTTTFPDPTQATELIPPQSLSSGPTPGSTSVSEQWQYPPPNPRPIFPPFNAPYPEVSAGYPDIIGNGMGMPGMNVGFFVPELGMQVGLNAENLMALETMMGDGFLNLPFSAEQVMGYYS